LTFTEKEVESVVGDVENVNDEPPPMTVKAETEEVDVTRKSELSAVVAPLVPATVIEQTTGTPILEGEVLLHESTEAVVGLP